MHLADIRTEIRRRYEKRLITPAEIRRRLPPESKVSNENLRQWLAGIHEPLDAAVWYTIAEAIGLTDAANAEIASTAFDLALEVLENGSTTEKAKQLAASIIRESRKPYR